LDDYNPFKRQNVNVKRNNNNNNDDNSPLKNELNKIKTERKIKENNYMDLDVNLKENKYRKKSQEKSQNKNKNDLIMEKSASIPCYYNNINIFTSNTGNNSSNNNTNNLEGNIDPNKSSKLDYKNYLLNKVSKNTIDDKLKIYEKNINKESRKNNKSRSNSNISKNN